MNAIEYTYRIRTSYGLNYLGSWLSPIVIEVLATSAKDAIKKASEITGRTDADILAVSTLNKDEVKHERT